VTSPYETLPAEAFWRSGAAEPGRNGITGLWRPKFPIDRSMRIATQGSCFAQHIGAELARRGYRWFEAERPLPVAPAEVNSRYNYGVFTYRTGNIYTPRLLRQWLSWASGESAPPEEAWKAEGGVVDPFRPRIEPEPFPDADAMRASRARTIARMAETLGSVDLFVFTLGLTEAWEDRETDAVYPLCPGTVGGRFDPARHVFANYRFREVVEDLEASAALLRRHNEKMNVLLTVSPVPLVATGTGNHVLVANGRSKGTLRAAAAELCEQRDDVDYFPSYELLREPPFGNAFYQENMRSVTPEGVAYVMDHFFRAHGARAAAEVSPAREDDRRQNGVASPAEEELVCEEILLDARPR